MLYKLLKAEKEYLKKHNIKKYLIYRRSAGVGDLVIGLYYAWRYAKRHNCKLIVDWRWSLYFNTPINLYSYLFQNCEIDGVEVIGDDSIGSIEYPEPFYPSFYNNENLHKKLGPYDFSLYGDSDHALPNFYKIFNLSVINANTIIISEQICMVPYHFQLKKDRKEVKKFITYLWSMLPKEITDYISNQSNKLLENKQNMVGLHIRLGNKDKRFKIFREVPTKGKEIINYIKENLLPAMKNIEGAYDHILVCADTKEAKELIEELMPGCIFYEKYFAPPGHEMHFAPGDDIKVDSKQMMLDALVEIYLLSHCEVVYSTYLFSLFAIISSYFNNEPDIRFL